MNSVRVRMRLLLRLEGVRLDVVVHATMVVGGRAS